MEFVPVLENTVIETPSINVLFDPVPPPLTAISIPALPKLDAFVIRSLPKGRNVVEGVPPESEPAAYQDIFGICAAPLYAERD